MYHVLCFIKPKKKSTLGVDISSTSLKILQLSNHGTSPCVEGFGSTLLPDQSMEGSAIKDIDAVAAAIKQLVSSCLFSIDQPVVVAVPDASAISKIIQINEGMTEIDIEELVLIEADKYIPFPINEINIDFNVLGPSSKNAAMQDVLIVASRAENVTNRVEALRIAGLEVNVVDVESYAVERALQLLKNDLPAGGENKVIAIVDIGSTYTHLFVLQNLKIIYARDEDFGGKQLINTIVREYGMTFQGAMEAVEKGLLPDDYNTRILTPFNENIFLQVKRSLQFFFSTSQYSAVDHIILAGGVAKQPGIAQLLQEHIGVPTTIANPLAAMTFSSSVNREQILQESPSLIVACGLALRHIERDDDRY